MGGQSTNTTGNTSSTGTQNQSSTGTQTTTPPPWGSQITSIPGIAQALYNFMPNTQATPQTLAGINQGTNIAGQGAGGNLGSALMSYFSNLAGNQGMTPQSQGASASLTNLLGGGPAANVTGPSQTNYANLVNSLQNNNSLNQLQTNLGATASGQYLGSNPYLENMLNQTNQGISNQINSQFAGAGQYGSAAHTQALASALATADNAARYQNFNTQQNAQLQANQQLTGANQTNQAQLQSALGGQLGAGQSNLSSYLSLLSPLLSQGQQGISNVGSVAGMQQGLNSGLYNDANSLLGLGNQAANVNQGNYGTLGNYANLIRNAIAGFGTTNTAGTSTGTSTNMGTSSGTSETSPGMGSLIGGGLTAGLGLINPARAATGGKG